MNEAAMKQRMGMLRQKTHIATHDMKTPATAFAKPGALGKHKTTAAEDGSIENTLSSHHDKGEAMEDNRALLKEKYGRGKQLGQDVNGTRT